MPETPAAARTLTPFEGKDVLAAAIEIPNAAGGLREAMAIDPQEYHHGERRYVVLELDCTKVRFDPVKDTGGLRRVHVFSATGATFVDADLVAKHVEAQRERIEAAKIEAERAERAEGIRRVPFGDELQDAHDRGEHMDGLVEGCADCQAEHDAAEAEEAEASG